MRRCRFDTQGKLTPTHRAGAPTAQGQPKVPPSNGWTTGINLATAPTVYSRHKCTADVELGYIPVVTTMGNVLCGQMTSIELKHTQQFETFHVGTL